MERHQLSFEKPSRPSTAYLPCTAKHEAGNIIGGLAAHAIHAESSLWQAIQVQGLSGLDAKGRIPPALHGAAVSVHGTGVSLDAQWHHAGAALCSGLLTYAARLLQSHIHACGGLCKRCCAPHLSVRPRHALIESLLTNLPPVSASWLLRSQICSLIGKTSHLSCNCGKKRMHTCVIALITVLQLSQCYSAA